MRWRIVTVALLLLGLFATAWVAREIAFARSGFDPDRASLDSDCDQCVLTETLDALPWIAGACLVFVAIVAVGWLWLRKIGWLWLRKRSMTEPEKAPAR